MTAPRRLAAFALAALSVFGSLAAADDEGDPLQIPSLKTLRSMNGIDPAPFDGFWKKWRLVTVRYRSDNGEQRFIYANDIAFAAMKDGDEEFPDGAAFGKVAFLATDDPQFPNSKEPSKWTRLQLMVKNSERFKETGGWSYWLQAGHTKPNPKDDHSNLLACHACHTIVKDRDFIFSVPTFVQGLAGWFDSPGTEFKDHFRLRSTGDLLPFERKVVGLLSSKPKTIRSYRMRLFSGSLYESIGPLTQFTQDGSVYALVDPIKKRFLVAEPRPATRSCAKPVHVYMDRRTYTNAKGRRVMAQKISKGVVCNGVNKWVKSFTAPRWLR